MGRLRLVLEDLHDISADNKDNSNRNIPRYNVASCLL